MKSFIVMTVTFASLAGFAQSKTVEGPIPYKVLKAAEKIKESDVRTVISKDTSNSPCSSDYVVEVQVKTTMWNMVEQKPIETWTTRNTAGVDKDGNVMETCGE